MLSSSAPGSEASPAVIENDIPFPMNEIELIENAIVREKNMDEEKQKLLEVRKNLEVGLGLVPIENDVFTSEEIAEMKSITLHFLEVAGKRKRKFAGTENKEPHNKNIEKQSRIFKKKKSTKPSILNGKTYINEKRNLQMGLSQQTQEIQTILTDMNCEHNYY